MRTAEYRRVFEVEDRQWWYAGMRAIALALLEPALRGLGERPRLLDAGCGTGGNLAHLARRARAVGIDLSAEALRFCRERGMGAARAELGALPFPDAVFDAVTSFDVIYHAWVADDRSAVREMARVLRPGGVMLVRVPALRILWGGHDLEVLSRHRYTAGELRRLLTASGLEVRRITYCNFFLFPLVLLRRSLDRATGRAGSDVSFLPSPLERSFRRLLMLEAALVRAGGSLPVGASVVALGRKAA